MSLMQDQPKFQIRPSGPTDAKIAFVGEAPGATEEMQGIPFVGSAGNLLTHLLTTAGINRTQCYLDNVILERPPNNDISKFIKFKKTTVETTEAYKTYEEKLYSRLRGIKANVVVALGRVPLYALTRRTSITRQRGSVFWSKPIQKKVVACIHPAAALRQYLYRHYILLDLRRVTQESESPVLKLPERKIKVKPNFEECIAYLQMILDSSAIIEEIAVDIEVINHEVSCISFAIASTDVISIPFMYKGDSYFNPEQERQVWLLIADIMQDTGLAKVGQNIVFDASFLFQKYGIRVHPIEDTMIAQGILYPDFPKGLDFITAQYTREPYYKDAGKQYLKLGAVARSEEEFWVYNAKDSAICLEVLPQMIWELRKMRNLDTYEEQRKLVEPLIYMSTRGIRMDKEKMDSMNKDVTSKIEEATDKFKKMVGYDINPNSSTQLKEYFYVKKNVDPYKNRKTGAITTDETALKRIARRGYEEANTLLDIRRLTKLKSTYLDVILSSDGRLKCSFNPIGTTSGRLSSSKNIFGEGTNLQNQPNEMRSFMIADQGYIMYDVDLSQAENRIVSIIAPEPTMIDAFEKGIDIHARTASLIFDIPIDRIIEMDRRKIHCEFLGNGQQTHRFWGKKANHAFNYGQGYRAFSLQMDISEADGKFIHSRYHSIYPGIRRYHAWIENQISSSRTLTNLFGRKRLYMDRKDYNLFKEAYSFIPQSSVADIINRWGLIPIYYEHNPMYKSVELLNQVHDSIIFQIPLDIGLSKHAYILRKIKDSLERPLTFSGKKFVIPAEVKVGYRLYPMTELNFEGDIVQQLKGIV